MKVIGVVCCGACGMWLFLSTGHTRLMIERLPTKYVARGLCQRLAFGSLALFCTVMVVEHQSQVPTESRDYPFPVGSTIQPVGSEAQFAARSAARALARPSGVGWPGYGHLGASKR